ncbi:MAG: S8 family serine peptidase [Actinomycetota bacterium]
MAVVAAGAALAPAGARPSQRVGAPEQAAGVILVRYRGDAAPFRRLALSPSTDAATVARTLRSRRDVLYAGPNRFYYLQATPNDPVYYLQWNFQNQPGGSARVERAWDLLAAAGKTPGAGAVAAVLDTGVAFENYQGPGYNGQPRNFAVAPDFLGTTFAAPFNAVRGDAHPNDEVAHGTHVAGTIAAGTNDGVGAAGIAPDATVIPVNVAKVQSGNVVLTEADVATGIRWAADHGAHVVNMSFGGRVQSELVADAVTYAREKGCLLVAAAGNDWTRRLLFPASLDAEVLSVTACGLDGKRAPYATYGQGLALSAPGGNFAQDLNRDFYPDGIVQQTISYLQDPSAFSTQIFEGTSMAAPHVSGAAALVVGAGVQGEPRVRSILLRTARGGRRHSPTLGWGVVDAGAAVETALTDADAAGRPARTMRVEALQMQPRLSPEGYTADIRVRVSDELFRPVQGAVVTLALSAKRKLGRLTAATDASGLARFTGSGLPDRPEAVVRAKILTVKRAGLRFSAPLSAELSDTMAIPR